MKQRVEGFDVARALAIFGMVLVNFKIAMGAYSGSPELLYIASLFEGRASALFVVLAGIGLTFSTSRARDSGDRVEIRQNRLKVLKRGVLLVLIGLAYTPVWEADILHFYGFYFMIGALLFTLTDRGLLVSGVLFVLVFLLMMGLFDYSSGWNWDSFAYVDFWTPEGMIRHIFFNGFHPVFPWTAFLILGMWLGRQDLSDLQVRQKLFRIALTVWVVTEGIFFLLREVLSGDASVSEEEIGFLFSTSILPPLPQYLLAAGSLAVLLILLSLKLSETYRQSRLIDWLSTTGQMSLTLYVAHVVIGMGLLEELGMLEHRSIEFSLSSAMVFSFLGVLFSVLWAKRFQVGPLEWLFRKVAG